MLPRQCSIREDNKDCLNTPAYIVSIRSDDGEFMIGVVCSLHKDVMAMLLDDIPINFEPLHYVGTECVFTPSKTSFLQYE